MTSPEQAGATAAQLRIMAVSGASAGPEAAISRMRRRRRSWPPRQGCHLHLQARLPFVGAGTDHRAHVGVLPGRASPGRTT